MPDRFRKGCLLHKRLVILQKKICWKGIGIALQSGKEVLIKSEEIRYAR